MECQVIEENSTDNASGESITGDQTSNTTDEHGSFTGDSIDSTRTNSSLGVAPKIEDFEIEKPISRGAFGKGKFNLFKLWRREAKFSGSLVSLSFCLSLSKSHFSFNSYSVARVL